MGIKLTISLLLAVLPAMLYGNAIQGHQESRSLTFVVSASGLPSSDTNRNVDPYVKVYQGVNQTGAEYRRIGRSETIYNNKNPEWNTVFKVQWFRGAHQILHFSFKDHDPLGPDDSIEEATINLDEYVDAREKLQVGLSKGGILTIQQTEPIAISLSVRNVPPKDQFGGLSDPYVICYFRKGRTGEDVQFAQTPFVTDVESTIWEHPVVFENYQPRTLQYLHFVVKDRDVLSRDELIGEATVEVDTLITAHKGKKEMPLSTDNSAVLITHVDNIPKAIIDKLRGPSAPADVKSVKSGTRNTDLPTGLNTLLNLII